MKFLTNTQYEHDGTQTPDIHGSIVFQNVHFKFQIQKNIY